MPAMRLDGSHHRIERTQLDLRCHRSCQHSEQVFSLWLHLVSERLIPYRYRIHTVSIRYPYGMHRVWIHARARARRAVPVYCILYMGERIDRVLYFST